MARHRYITHHKRFVIYGIHPDFYLAKTSFMIVPLYEILIK
jgi:hypothetical protein